MNIVKKLMYIMYCTQAYMICFCNNTANELILCRVLGGLDNVGIITILSIYT